MKTLITFCILSLSSFALNAQSYNGNIYYEKLGWDGITANCNVSVIGTTSQNGIYFESVLKNLDIKSLTVAQKVISGSQIPSHVKSGISSNARVELDFDVYVNNVLINRNGQPTIYWAQLQGLPNSDNYKPAVREAGYALYNNRAIEVRNVRVKNLSYRVDQTYYDQVRKDIAGANNNTSANSSNQSNGNSGSTELLINGQGSSTSTSTTTKPLNNYDPNTGLYSNPLVTGNSSTTSDFQKNYQLGQDIGNTVVAIASLFGPSPEELARREREANLRAEREEAANRARVEKTRVISSRKELIKKYPDGKTPLSFEAKNVSQVYFFVYSYKESTIENDNSIIYISNVFALPKYADGTWPFKTSLMQKITNENKDLDLILSGYYDSKTEADHQQKYFISNANNAAFTVKGISFEIKKTSGTSNSQTDFWGNSNKDAESPSTIKDNSAATDFWGNPIKSTKTEQNIPTIKKQDSIKPKVKVDFWGNPIKE
jgi:hypothetical protein